MKHGAWCNSKTIPMTCKYCGQEIFYFSCNHGCKVFFDERGGDWPIHDCNGFNIKRKINTNVSKEILTENVSWTFISADEIEEDYKEKITKNKPLLYNSNVPILFVEAKKDNIVKITGKIKEIINNVDLFKKFNINRDSIIGSNLLKEFGKENYQQITIHVINIDDNSKDSYTTLIRCNFIRDKKIRINDNVTIKLRGEKILDVNIWNCIDIGKLDDLL